MTDNTSEEEDLRQSERELAKGFESPAKQSLSSPPHIAQISKQHSVKVSPARRKHQNSSEKQQPLPQSFSR